MADHKRRAIEERGVLSFVGIVPRAPAPRRPDYIVPAGPVATIGALAKSSETPWFWANCPMPCCHHAALPWSLMLERFGPDASSDRIRRALRCTVCGRKGGTLTQPSWHGFGNPPTPMQIDQTPVWARPAPPTWSRRDPQTKKGPEA